jgi:hypothetical protein
MEAKNIETNSHSNWMYYVQKVSNYIKERNVELSFAV